ncbi:hypothetical protein EEW87_004255 [Janibacter melonis]|uniref:Uncharacterized protein n=1 Tax=Janibacter melonis TaxID=262209 RepID=A0A5P8FKM2_9MICO|nr:hypothetical protein [Janibacter melonis]QFQ29711.2 hypothetical protein EEW87_004255 [Janibacter melonis]
MARVVHHSRAYSELLTSPAVQALVHGHAERVAEAAGDGHVARQTENPHTRARSAVIAVTRDAREANSRSNAMIRALGGS